MLLDSISQQDPTLFLEALRETQPTLLVLDTTCYEVSDARITRIVRSAVSRNICTILVRSHIKLDCFGVEYSRLGSTTCIKPQGLQADQAKFVSTLLASHRSAMAALGLRATPFSLLPFFGDAEFRALNRARVMRIEENNATIAAMLAARGVEGVVTYHHSKYCTVEPRVACDAQRILSVIEAFGHVSRDRGLCAWRADSFGFDFTALSNFVDLQRGRSVFRVSASDMPDCAVYEFVEVWSEFLQSQVNNIESAATFACVT